VEAIDIILLVLLGIGTYRGYQTGLLMQLLGIIAFFLAIIGGFHLMYWGTELLSDHINGYESFLPIISFVIIFIVIIIAINLIGKGLKAVLNMTILGSFDNITGAIVGLLKWALVLSILIWVAGTFGQFPLEEYYEDTTILPLVASIGPYLLEMFSGILPLLEDIGVQQERIQQASAL
jgi:membrane protein required for colicin V production